MMQNSTAAEFMLSIFSVKLAVKFPCRMSLHQDGKPITTQVQSISNVFTFNQDVTIKSSLKSDVQISAYLSTGKGGSILAGLITMSVDNLAAKQGTRLSIPLQKCIDTAATADLKVNHAWIPQQKNFNNMTRSSAGGVFVRSSSPQINKVKLKTQNDFVETRSEYQAQTPRKSPTIMVGGNLISKQKDIQPKRFNNRDLGNTKISFRFDNPDVYEDDIRETKTIGGTGLKYRRQKDKQRMDKLAAKKITDDTQNNLKLDIMKYKMKGEQLQKTVAQKTKIIKQLKDQILEHDRKNIERAYIQQQLSSKQNTIKILQDRIANLNSQNSNIRQTITQNIKAIGELKENIRFDILKNKQQYAKKQQILRVELTDCKGRIVELEADLSNKQTQLIKAKKYIEDLQSAAQHKIFEHDRLIQDLKKQQSQTLKELYKKISQHQSRIEQLQKQIITKNTSINQLRQSIIKFQQNERSHEQKIQMLEFEKNQLLVFKADFFTLTKKYNSLQQILREEQKNSRKLLESKTKQNADNIQISNKNIKSLQYKLTASNDKIKQHKNKIQQLQSLLSQSKQQQQKSRKSIQKLQRTIQQYTTKLQISQKQLRSQQNKIQHLQKQIGEKSNNSSHMQSLYKIQLQHAKENILTLTKDLDQTSNKYMKTKENLELTKNQKTKLQNKIQLQQQNITRLNQYIKEKKIQYDNKQNQHKQYIKSTTNTIKTMQENDKTKQKQINAWQIKDLTNCNKIDKLQKNLQQANNRIDKLEKITLVKLTEQRQKLNSVLQQTKIKLAQAVEQNKFITNQRLKFQSQSNKNYKINNVLNEEKLSVINQLNKSKNLIQRYEKNEQKLNVQIKSANQQNKKLNLKIQVLEKELAKNKDILNQTMNSIFTLKNNMRQSIQIQKNKSITNLKGKTSVVKKQSYIDNLTSSRVIASYSNPSINAQIDIKRISQILQSTSKQQQNTILVQQQSINHYKDTIDKLEKQLATLSFSSQANQNKYQQAIDHLNSELQSTHQKILNLTNNYEDKISKLQTQINKKQKDIKLNKSTIGSLKYQLETLKKKLEILLEQSQIKEHKNGQKITDLMNQCNFLQVNIKNLQNQRRSLETKLYSTQQDLAIQIQQRAKKQKYITELTQKWTVLRIQFEELTKVKKDNLQQLLALRQQVQALKENNQKTQQMLKNQQKNNKKLQDFINDLIKQKENIVKVQLQSSSKAIQMEGIVLQMKNLLQNKDQQLKQKQQQISQSKSMIKTLQGDIKNLQADIKEYNIRINTLNSKIEQKDKKILEKQTQLKQYKSQSTNTINKNKQQMKIMRQQYQMLQKRSQSIEQQKQSKIFNLQKPIIQLESNIQSLNTELTQKQELIFFEKQRASLSESHINDIKKGQSEVNLLVNQYQKQINELNQQLTYKQETLFEYSGKIYQLQQKLQAKQAEILIRQQKIDIDWQCRHDQICQQYEHKIQVLEKQKKYIKDKLDIVEQQKAKLISQRQRHSQQFQKQIGSSKTKQKLLQQEKLQQINQKNKQIQTLKNQITLLNNQIKNAMIEAKKKQNQIVNKDEVIKKLQLRINQNDKGQGSLKKQYEQEINNMKKNENAVKALKEQIKNAQWVTERQIKKITQIFIQRVVNCFPEGKQKLVEPIRALQSSMSTVINYKV